MALPQLYLQCGNPACLIYFEYNGGKRRQHCSNACKQAAYRGRVTNTPGQQ